MSETMNRRHTMIRPNKPTNEEKILLEVVTNSDGFSELECALKFYITSMRSYISPFERKTGIKLFHARTQSDTGKHYTRYQCDTDKIAKKVIDYLNGKSAKRGEVAITAEQEQRILNRYA